ncbi:MAG: hypothetical protein ACI8XB_002010 [Patiriisocius sp.]
MYTGCFFYTRTSQNKTLKMTLKHLGLLLAVVLSLIGCVKDKITIDENTIIPGLTPSLAVPLGQANLTLEEADDLANSDVISYNSATGYYEYILDREIFNYPANRLLAFDAQDISDSYELDQFTIDLINLGSAGDVILAPPVVLNLELDVNQGELLDSIMITEGTMELTLSSTIKHDFTFSIDIPSLKLNGSIYTNSFVLDYNGSVPASQSVNLDLTGYTMDLTGDGTMDNLIIINAPQILITHSGETVAMGENILAEMNFDVTNFNSVWGYFGQYTEIIDVDSNDVNFFDDLNGGDVYFSDPRIELSIINTAGVDMEVYFSSIIAPSSGSTVTLSGSDLSEIPIITAAANPGDSTITLHTIDNNGTSPSLSAAIDADPDYFIYTASGTTNPNGVAANFLLDTSFVQCNAQIILPAFGYADNFTITDTIDADINDLIQDASSSGDVITYEDIENVLVRLFMRNGLPVQAGVKAYFTDSNYVVVDSVFMTNDYQFIVEPGLVDFSLPPTDPDFGRVYSATEAITDISFTGVQIQHLIDNNATRMILQAIGITSSANTQEEIKFYPNDFVEVKVSAKVDLNLDLSE